MSAMKIERQKIGLWWVVVGLCMASVMSHGSAGESATASLDAPSVEDPDRVDESIDEEEVSALYPKLAEAIDEFLAGSSMRGVSAGIHVEDLMSGEVIYSHEADRLMDPASNMKLVTAAAVLDELGPQHTLETLLSTDARANGRVENLYVRGEGEAFILFKDMLDWARQLRVQGVEAIDGDVVIDDGVFDGGYLPPGFDLRETGDAWRSPIGAVSVNFNAVTAIVKPGERPGMEPRVRLDPPNDYVQVVNRARTTTGSLQRIHVDSEAGEEGTVITIGGTIGAGASEVRQRRRINDPPAFAGAVVAEAMRMMGIEFEGQIRRGVAPSDGERLFRHESSPMIDTVSAMNKWSNNFMAEQLLRLLGTLDVDDPSTWEASQARLRYAVDSQGLLSGQYELGNGSGLWGGNLLSARQLVTLLSRMQRHRFGPEFVSSLPIAGVDGTLRHRLREESTQGNVRAKTGTLRNVTALSGYLTTASGRRVAFSVLFNDTPRRAWFYRDEQDRIVEMIAEFDG